MRIAVIIISVIVMQASASFFSDLKGSMSSVKSSVGKLFSDVAGDVKDTFHCTVHAVRQAISGDKTINPAYHQKCQGDKPMVIPLPSAKPVHIYITISEPPPPPPPPPIIRTEYVQVEVKPTSPPYNFSYNTDKIEQEIHSVENFMHNEAEIMASLNSKLEHEFENLSNHVNEDFMRIENEQKKISLEKVIKNIDLLRQQEAIDINNTNNEIHDVFGKIMSKLDKNDTDKVDVKAEIKSALAEIDLNKNNNVEKELEQWKEEETKAINDIKLLLNTTTTTTTTKKPKPKLTVRTTTKPPKTAATTEKPSDYDALISKDKASLDQALDIIKSSKKKAAMMAAILKNLNAASGDKS